MAWDAHEKQCGTPFTAEGRLQPVLPSPRTGAWSAWKTVRCTVFSGRRAEALDGGGEAAG